MIQSPLKIVFFIPMDRFFPVPNRNADPTDPTCSQSSLTGAQVIISQGWSFGPRGLRAMKLKFDSGTL